MGFFLPANSLPAVLVPLGDISPGGFQPRAGESSDHVAALADNMHAVGFLPEHPLEVFSDGGRYVLISGHHRYHAAIIAGIDAVPVVVKVGSELELRFSALSSNDSNLPMKPCEQARGYGDLVDLGATVGDVAKRMCKPVEFIERRLLLLKLDPAISKLVDSKNMPLSLAERLSGLSANEQVRAVGKISGLELPAALAAVDAIILASQGMSFPGFETMSIEDKEKSKDALSTVNQVLKTMDRGVGSITDDQLSLALKAMKNPQSTLDYLDVIERELKRMRVRVLEQAGASIAGGGAMVTQGKRFSGRLVVELRKQNGLSVRDLREVSGVANITDIEKNRVVPHPRTIRRLADALGVTIEELMA